MKRFNKELFIIFIPTLTFLIFYTGLFLLIRMKINLSNDYETFSFAEGNPSNIEILLMGFKNLKEAFYFVLLTTLFTIMGGSFIKNQIVKNGGENRTVLNSLILTFLLTLLYTVYRLLNAIGYHKDYISIFLKETKMEIITLSITYFLISIPIVFLFSKQMAKSLGFEREPQHTTTKPRQV